MASCVFSQTNLPSLFLSDMCFGNSPRHLKNVNAQSREREWRKEGERKKKERGEREKEKNEERERESGPQFLWRLAPANPRNPQRMRLEERARKGWRRGAYENDHGWRQSLIRRKPWVSAVACNGSSCLGGRLNNTVCLSRGVGIGSFTARIVRIYDCSMDWLSGYFLTETLNYPPHRFRDIFAFGSLIARRGIRSSFLCSM